MTMEAGRRMHAERGRKPDKIDAESVGRPGLALGRAMFRRDHAADTGRKTRARAALDQAAELARAGGAA